MISINVIAAAFATLALAAPAPTEQATSLAAPLAVRAVSDIDEHANLTARGFLNLDLWARVFTFDGDNCPNKDDPNQQGIEQDGYGYQCIRTSSPSFYVVGTGCNTRIWNDADCSDSSWTVPDSSCWTGTWQSISLECGRGR